MDTNPTEEVAAIDDLMSVFDAPAEEVEPTAPTDETPAAEVTPDQPVADEEEVELDGETFKVPKKLAEAVLRQKDYTQKTQEVAERRRSIEDREQYVEAREQLMQQSFQEAAKLQALQEKAAQFQAVDWNTLMEQDPQRAMQLSFARQQLQTELAEKQQVLQRPVANANGARNKHAETQIELGRAELQRRVGTLTAADRQKTWEQGVSLGFSEAELQRIPDPRVMHAIYKAAKWDALQADKPKAMQKVAEAPKVIKPMAPATPKAQRNQAAYDRLKSTGRAEELTKFL